MPTPTAAPARIFGAVNPLLYAGTVVPGIVDATQRTANGALLQSALDYAASAGKYIEMDQQRVEYDAQRTVGAVKTGLHLPYGQCPGFIGAGKRTMLIQYASAYPALTISGAPGSGALSSATFRNFALGMGVQGIAGSRGLLIGDVWKSSFSGIEVLREDAGSVSGGSDTVTNPEVGIGHWPSGQAFSCSFQDIVVRSGQTYCWDYAPGTGNRHANIYIGGGGSAANRLSLSSAGLRIQNGYEGVWEQLNIEWIRGIALALNNQPGVIINSMHIEGIQYRASGGVTLINVAGTSDLHIKGLSVFECSIRSGDHPAGTPSVISTSVNGKITVDGLYLKFKAGDVDGGKNELMAIAVYNDAGGSLTDMGRVTIRNIKGGANSPGTGGIILDASLPLSPYGQVGEVEEYRLNYSRSAVRGAEVSVSDANYTAYAAHQDIRITYGALTADRKVILSDKVASASPGNGIPRRVGDSVTISRGTGAFNLDIRDAADATTIATLAASTVTRLWWTGSAWVTG